MIKHVEILCTRRKATCTQCGGVIPFDHTRVRTEGFDGFTRSFHLPCFDIDLHMRIAKRDLEQSKSNLNEIENVKGAREKYKHQEVELALRESNKQ